MEAPPPPSPTKLLAQFRDWQSGDEMPGRTLAYFKTGFLNDVLEAIDSDETRACLEVWNTWERGEANPADVMTQLKDLGLESLLKSLADADG